jgi:hypothetical protein
MMATFHYPRVEIKINNILVRCSITEKYPREIVAVQLALPRACLLHTDSRAKRFKV